MENIKTWLNQWSNKYVLKKCVTLYKLKVVKTVSPSDNKMQHTEGKKCLTCCA